MSQPSSPPSDPAPTFRCPQCQAPVRANDINCERCGVNLAWAAALSERQVLATMPAPSDAPYVADVILPRFGEFLVQNGNITNAQLKAALVKQADLLARGQQITIGQILLEMDMITREQLDLASIQQVRQLQQALQESNQQLEERVARRTSELQQALRRLTELNELKVNFVANISHELRTPLVPIKSYNELLGDGSLGPLTGDQHKALEVTARAILRLEELVNNLIQFASTIRGETTLNPAPISVAELATPVLRASSAKALKANVQLESALPPGLPGVVVDAEKMHWVLFQLFDNAIKFTPAGGQVTFAAEARGARVRLSVRDTGIGIAPEKMAELFQPFHQIDGSSTRHYGGTGLGLALIKRIVEAHDSQVHVESAPNQGSLFWFDLPAANS